MAKLTTAEFIDAIKELTVLELNDLVKACEEEFGVSAAAGVVVAGPAAGGAAAASAAPEAEAPAEEAPAAEAEAPAEEAPAAEAAETPAE